jgi:rhodanese-related sulfurtransferase
MKASSVLRFAAEYVRSPHEGLRSLTPEEVRARLTDPNVFIYDCNLEVDWAKAHIPGAQHVGIDRYEVDKLPAGRDATLIFYCAAPYCLACNVGARRALELGYRRVFIMPEGRRGWRTRGFPLESAVGATEVGAATS